MKKLITLVLVFATLFTATSFAFSETIRPTLLHSYSAQEVRYYDYTKFEHEDIFETNFAPMSYLVASIGEKTAYDMKLSLEVYEDGSLAICYLRHDGGYTRRFNQADFKRIWTKEDNMIHVLFSEELINAICYDLVK